MIIDHQGDKGAKTKPSIHTQKYKKMFGEFKKDLQDVFVGQVINKSV